MKYFLISMFDEHSIVMKNIHTLRDENCRVFLVQSDDGVGVEESSLEGSVVEEYWKLPNLAPIISDKKALPSNAIGRNFSFLFTRACRFMEKMDETPDLVVAMVGDTLITDYGSFHRREDEMRNEGVLAMVSQAWGQTFWDRRRQLTREQGPDVHDFACCIWMMNGAFVRDTKCFSEIDIINEYTSEECLGNELVRNLPDRDWNRYVRLLNVDNPYHAYSYRDGIVYHAASGGRPAHR